MLHSRICLLTFRDTDGREIHILAIEPLIKFLETTFKYESFDRLAGDVVSLSACTTFISLFAVITE